MSGEIDYVGWFQQVDARVSELEGELAKLRPLRESLSTLAQQGDPARSTLVKEPRNAPVSEPRVEAMTPGVNAASDVYSNMTSLEAALHYLRVAQGVRGTSEVADALLAGGFPTESEHFTNNIYTTLMRLVEQGLVERVGRGRWSFVMNARVAERGDAEREPEPESDRLRPRWI